MRVQREYSLHRDKSGPLKINRNQYDFRLTIGAMESIEYPKLGFRVNRYLTLH